MVSKAFVIDLLLLLLASGSSSVGLPREELKGPDIQWIDCLSSIPAPLSNTTLPSVLPSTLQCGRLDVPLDYSKEFGEGNKITLGFSIYRPNNSHGVINL
jgi:hypothetical protein